MSWASGAGEAAGEAGNAASSVGSAASSGGSAIADAGSAGSGFSSALDSGPQMTPEMGQNLSQYGTASPSVMDKVSSGLEQFQKGSNQNITDAYKNFGNNAKTYGYMYGKLQGLANSGGGGNQPANVVTNVSYQQPQSTYLKRRGY